MKTFVSLMMVVFVSLAAVDSAEAKRFGSGGFGKAFKTSPFKKASPQKMAPKNADANKSGLAGSAARRPGMGGLMGGLLAGGMFAYLLGNGAFEGIQMMDILLFGLIGFVLFKLFLGQKVPAVSGTNGQGLNRQTYNQHKPVIQGFEQPNSAGDGVFGASDEIPMNIPADFDVTGFANRSLEHYKLVHKAWDQGNMSTVKEYLHGSLLEQLQAERSQQAEVLDNEVLDLAAHVVRSEVIDRIHSVSILFRGRMRDLQAGQEQGIYDVWHLEQTSSGSWLIIGIEAE
jgi:predicted lipid-binding transport protein (Tim44 family)